MKTMRFFHLNTLSTNSSPLPPRNPNRKQPKIRIVSKANHHRKITFNLRLLRSNHPYNPIQLLSNSPSFPLECTLRSYIPVVGVVVETRAQEAAITTSKFVVLRFAHGEQKKGGGGASVNVCSAVCAALQEALGSITKI
jgi:hypothetical protein